MQQMAQTSPMQQPKEIANMFKSEKEFLELMKHEWELEEIELRLLQKYDRMPEEDEDKKLV